MKKLYWFIPLVLCTAIVTLLFSGCSKQTSGNTEGEKISEINIWTESSHSKGVYNKLVDQFNKTTGKEKGIKLIYEVKEGNLSQNIEVALQSKMAPEMFSGGRLANHAENGYVIALEDLPGGSKLIEKFEDYLRDFYNTYQGKTYSLPFSATTRGLVYNKDMFRAAGIVDENGEPTPPETFEELREYAKILTDHSKKEYGIIFPIKYASWFESDIYEVAMGSVGFNGYNPVTGEYDYTGYEPIIETILGIKEDQSYMPGAEGLDNDHARSRFAEGNIGMKFAYSFDVGVLNDQFPAKCDWGVAPLPVVDKDKAYRQRYDVASVCYINNEAVKTIEPEKLMVVYEWLHSDEVAIELYKECVNIPISWELVEGIELENPKTGWVDFCKMTQVSALEPVALRKDTTGQLTFSENFINNIWAKKMSVREVIDIQTEIDIEGV